MKISQNAVFTDLANTGAPDINYTVYDPIENFDRSELLGYKRGSILIQLADSGVGCFYPETTALWYKRHNNGTENDWALITALPASGNADPSSSSDALCALPVGAIYRQTEGVNCADQLWVKVNNTCNNAGCGDWMPLLMTVTRLGDEFDFDPTTYTLNLPVNGLLTDEGNGEYKWTPDDGGPGFEFFTPLFTDNGDGTYTFDRRDGSSPITFATQANLTIPADISAVQRPWVQVGNATATNATNVGVGATIFHSGTIIRGSTTQGTTGTVGAELRGNNSLGAGNHGVTGASNSTVGGGTGNSVLNTVSGFIGAGDGNTINGVADPAFNINSFIGAGYSNDNGAHSAAIVAGDDNVIQSTGTVAFIGAGSKNTANGNGSAVLGGYFNAADAFWSVALGSKAKSTHIGAFVINTLLGTNPATDTDTFASTTDSEFAIRVGSVRILTNLAGSAGMTMAGGASSWVAVSDERAKNNIQPLAEDVLAGYKTLVPVSYFMGEQVGAGITAQNWYESFPFLERKTVGNFFGVSQAERDGIQDKAIKQLAELVETLSGKVTALEAKLAQYQYEGD